MSEKVIIRIESEFDDEGNNGVTTGTFQGSKQNVLVTLSGFFVSQPDLMEPFIEALFVAEKMIDQAEKGEIDLSTLIQGGKVERGD